MKKKIWKVLALILALGLLSLVLIFANALCGNPVSKLLAENAAGRYLEAHFPDTDYYVERVGFNFKDANYYAHIRSDSSMDTQFSLHIDMLGNICFDTYEDVLSGAVTAQRLDREYRTLTDAVMGSPGFPYFTDICYGTLEIYPQDALLDPQTQQFPIYTIKQEELIQDRIYDIRELGAQCGHLVIYVDSDEVTVEKAAKVLLAIRAAFDEANAPFRVISFTLQQPRPEEGPRTIESISVDNFPYEDIYAEGLEERIARADAALKAYYAEQDALKEKFSQ